jgi:hypothetical protein
MNNRKIYVAKDYSDTPAGRFCTDGSYSGERFREEFLYPALIKYDHVEVNLDGTLGLGSSFLEEAFGGLIREKNMDISDVEKKLTIISSRKLYENRIFQYITDAQQVRSRKKL